MHLRFPALFSLLSLSFLPLPAAEYEADVVIYGGTSAAVIAAVQVKKMGKTALIVCPEKRLGGLSSGGLGFTDTGDKSVIGGLSRDFYHRVFLHYQKPEAWKWQKKEEYGNKGQGTPAMDGENRTMWIFEPGVAETIFEEYVREFGIAVHRDQWLNRASGVKKTGQRITELHMLSGDVFRGGMFLDATYEGDLLATADVDYHVGREANAEYGERWNGVQTGVLHHRHHFGALKTPISPYVVPGDPASGLLPRINPETPGPYGSEDKGVQAYCFRMCLTDHPDNRVLFSQPDGYDAGQYELLARIYEAGWTETFEKFDPIPNRKTDTNNHGPFSTDNIGYNWEYPEASYERRQEIIEEHKQYQLGWIWFILTDPRVPADVKKEMSRWGLPKDEYSETGHWSPQLYIREARRMIGAFVMTENELRKEKPTPDSVGMGSYTIDSHNIQRYVTPEGHVQNEGDIGVSTKGPYQIAYGSLVPKRGQAENLLVPVCVSSTHIAFGSIRMEPVFMILGQSAATAAVMALDAGVSVQEVPYAELRERLLRDGQILESDRTHAAKPGQISPAKIEGIVVDDEKAVYTGEWQESTVSDRFVGAGYRHDGDSGSTERKTAVFTARLPKAGRYEVRVAYSAMANRAKSAPVSVSYGKESAAQTLDQTQAPAVDGLFHSLGSFDFPEGDAAVTFSNEKAGGHVIVDAVQWLPVKEAGSSSGN